MKNNSEELQDFLHKLGQQICTTRKRLNISQAQLAEKADVSVTYVSKIECAHRNVSAYMLARIMNALNTEYIRANDDRIINEPLYRAVYDITSKLNNEQLEDMLKIMQLLAKIITKE